MRELDELDGWNDAWFLETLRCGECGHFDSLNQCCWVIADDGICREVTEIDYCKFGWKINEDGIIIKAQECAELRRPE
ncbi:hypothetical protein ES702_00568 [subsurface metagenome]